MPQFLSESWFSEVEKIRAEMGEIPVPDAIKNVKLNIVVIEHPEGEKQLHMVAGDFQQGLLDDAPTKVTVPFPVAVAVFKLFDPDAKYVGEYQAHLTAHWISHLSPYDMAFHFSRTYILGSPLDPGYLLCIPVWILIGCLGIRHGSRVYMDVFFRRV